MWSRGKLIGSLIINSEGAEFQVWEKKEKRYDTVSETEVIANIVIPSQILSSSSSSSSSFFFLLYVELMFL